MTLHTVTRAFSLRAPIAMLLATAATASADFTVVLGAQNADQWFAGVGPCRTADFTGFTESTQITDQYAALGVQFSFPGSAGNGVQGNSFMYPQDGWGIVGVRQITMSFDGPMRAFAAYYPGDARFAFYSGSSLLHATTLTSSSANNFAGFTSDAGFDRVVLSANEPVNMGLFIDNVYFSAVPDPACPADLDRDGAVDGIDLGVLLGAWGPCSGTCPADLNLDGAVDGNDLGTLLAAWGPCGG